MHEILGNGQRPSGRWETVAGTSGRLIGRYQCSCCGECRELATATLARYKYCPNCGAAMDGTVEKRFYTHAKSATPNACALSASTTFPAPNAAPGWVKAIRLLAFAR